MENPSVLQIPKMAKWTVLYYYKQIVVPSGIFVGYPHLHFKQILLFTVQFDHLHVFLSKILSYLLLKLSLLNPYLSTSLSYYEYSLLNHSQECQEMPNKILLAERILLQTLCFDLQLVHPYRTCVDKMNEKLKRKEKRDRFLLLPKF